jgi:hypothetical protein
MPTIQEKIDDMETIKELYKDIVSEAIQKTEKSKTKKGYDTTGYGYQWCVDRFNDTLGAKWGFTWELIKEIEGQYKTGTSYFDITVKLGIWIIDKESIRYCVGGHTGINYSDAFKGAITNAFKKTAAFWGVGAKAFRGEIDDDTILPENESQKQPEKANTYYKKPDTQSYKTAPKLNKEEPMPEENKTVFSACLKLINEKYKVYDVFENAEKIAHMKSANAVKDNFEGLNDFYNALKKLSDENKANIETKETVI